MCESNARERERVACAGGTRERHTRARRARGMRERHGREACVRRTRGMSEQYISANNTPKRWGLVRDGWIGELMELSLQE